MLSKMYSLQRAADVRELLAAGQEVKLVLGLIYMINECQGRVGYLLKSNTDRQQAEIVAVQQRRRQLSATLKDYLKLNGYTMDRKMGGRVFRVTARKARGQARPPGGLKDITQKGLFVFSDMYSYETLMNITINQTMFQE